MMFRLFLFLAICIVNLVDAGGYKTRCTKNHIYVSPDANAAAGLKSNGSSPRTPFATVQDASNQVEYLMARSDGSTQVVVNLAKGVYVLDTYLRLNEGHSGSSSCPVIWQAPDGDAVLSGGTSVTGWTRSGGNGVWIASVPAGSRTRALFVDGVSMQRARESLNQTKSTYTSLGFTNDGPHTTWSAIEKLRYTELRAVGTFVDRYTPVDYLSPDGSMLVMKQPAWYRQLIGYDTMTNGGTAEGLYLENSLTFLTEAGSWYLDVETNTLYYKPMNGTDPNHSTIILPRLEVLLAVGGFTIDRPAHDMQFVGITFAHTTWNFPSSEYGFPDQQTGAFIGESWNRSDFEATRPHWFQTPGSVQVSAAQHITFQGGAVTCTGAAGMGVGNDDNAHLSDVGLGAMDITISGVNFTQTGANALQIGGVQANAHHPIVPAMVNSHIVAEHNYFDRNAFLYNSGANIFVTYTEYSRIVSNTITNTPYSGICMGYGWGANDPNGTPAYAALGLYAHQPIYYTPTTAHDNLIAHNYLYNIGLKHDDLGGIYTLSMNNGTVIRDNVIAKGLQWGLYHDEGSRYFTDKNNVVDAAGGWLFLNLGQGYETGNNTVVDCFGSTDEYLTTGYDEYGDYIDHNTFFNASHGWPKAALPIVKAAGAKPGQYTMM